MFTWLVPFGPWSALVRFWSGADGRWCMPVFGFIVGQPSHGAHASKSICINCVICIICITITVLSYHRIKSSHIKPQSGHNLINLYYTLSNLYSDSVKITYGHVALSKPWVVSCPNLSIFGRGRCVTSLNSHLRFVKWLPGCPEITPEIVRFNSIQSLISW